MKYHPFGINSSQEGKRAEFIRRASAPQSGFSYHFKRGKIRYDQLREAQVGILWRCIRAHAVAKYQLNAFEQIANLDNPMMWTVPMPDSSPANRSRLFEELSNTWTGKALLPTDPELLPEYLLSFQRTKKLLGIRLAEAHIDDSIWYGLEELQHWPNHDEIVDFEHAQCLAFSAKYYSQGTNGTLQYLISQHGYRKSEAEAVLKLAKRVSTSSIELNDPDADRRSMIARLEHAIATAREQMDLRGELAAINTLAKIQGLDRDVQVNPMEQFIELIQSSAKSENARLPAPGETWVQDDRDVDTYLAGGSDDDSITINVEPSP